MTITDEIKQICAEIAEKLPQISGGGGTTPSFTDITKRAHLIRWYSYIADDYLFYYDEEVGDFVLTADTLETVDYPLYTQNITDFSYLTEGSVYDEYTGMTTIIGVRVKKFCGTLDTSSGTNFSYMFCNCEDTEDIGELTDTSKGTNFDSMFSGCNSLKSVPPLDTSNGTRFWGMFQGCLSLTSVPPLDVSNGTILSWMFDGCESLTNVTVKNIKANLQVGYASMWGHLLTVDSLVGLIYECRDTGSTKTLTIGKTNLSKLANVYVKLVDITDEMRAEDAFIDEKKPFEVCESNDEGAMLITNYVGLKNWKLA